MKCDEDMIVYILGSLGHSWVCLGLSQGFQASSATLASRFPKLPGIQASPTCLRSSTCVFVSFVVGSCLVDRIISRAHLRYFLEQFKSLFSSISRAISKYFQEHLKSIIRAFLAACQEPHWHFLQGSARARAAHGPPWGQG